MRSLVFEANTWLTYEALRKKDKKLQKTLCQLLKEMLRDDPGRGMGKPEPLNLKTAVDTRRIAQSLDSPGIGGKSQITNEVTTIFPPMPSKSISCTLHPRPTAVFRLKNNLSGLWSRRISQKDRVIYTYDDHHLYIFAIGGHYDQF